MIAMSAADHPGATRYDERRHRHDLEGVDLVADAHGAELGGEAGADLGGEGDAGDERRDLPGVGEAADQAGERLGADLLAGP